MKSRIEYLKQKVCLYAEDDDVVRDVTVMLLRRLFREVVVASDGEEALAMFRRFGADIVLLDNKMPRYSGLEVAAHIRRTNHRIPIVIISAHAEIPDLLQAVKLQLVDYLVKPFGYDRLLDVLEACLEAHALSRRVSVGEGMTYDEKTKCIERDGGPIQLSKNEAVLLELLLQRRGAIVPSAVIEQHVWQEEISGSAALLNLVKRIRHKIGKDVIVNIKNLGYRLT